MTQYWLKIDLLSDTHFGRGDGLAGVVNAEVQHDDNGLPYLGGKAVKGILGAMCAEILSALDTAQDSGSWADQARRLFGDPGSSLDDMAIMHVGDACLPEDLQAAVADEIRYNNIERLDILESLTTLRRQTAMNAETGAPKKETLRAIRVIQRGLSFIARLSFYEPPTPAELALLAACVKAFRRIGTNRNRGMGRIKAELYDANPVEPTIQARTDVYFQQFKEGMPS